jgi:hypothetical protein
LYVGPKGLFYDQKCFYAIVDNVLYRDPFAGWSILSRYLDLSALPSLEVNALQSDVRAVTGDRELDNRNIPNDVTRRLLRPCGGKFVLTINTAGYNIFAVEKIITRGVRAR